MLLVDSAITCYGLLTSAKPMQIAFCSLTTACNSF